MRLGPIPVAFHSDINSACHFAAQSSLTTHPGPMAAEACAFLAYATVRAIHSPTPPSDAVQDFLDTVVQVRLPMAVLLRYHHTQQDYIGILTPRNPIGRKVRVIGKGAEHGATGTITACEPSSKSFIVDLDQASGVKRKKRSLEIVAEQLECIEGDQSSSSRDMDPSSASAVVAMLRMLNSKEPDDSTERNWNW